MKPETLIFNKVRKIIPGKSDKTIFFVGITKTSQEVFFYSFINGEVVQCYTLAENYELDENDSDYFRIVSESKKGIYVESIKTVKKILDLDTEK